MYKTIFFVFAVAVISGSTAKVFANGFALSEQSASGLGNAFAGGGASVEDASTLFFNPAGMTYLPNNQLVIAIHAIRSSTEFNNNGSQNIFGRSTVGSEGGDSGGWAFIPNLYFAKAINDKVRFGIGMNAPFGINSDYNKGWVGRYQALKTELKTININPSIAIKVSNQVSLGLGFSAMYAEAEQTNAVDFGTICTIALNGCGIGAAIQKNDGFVRVHGEDWGYGWNAGVVFQMSQTARLSLAYRSQVNLKLGGHVDFSNVPGAFALSPLLSAGFSNSAVSANLITPDSASASIFQNINHRWDVMADLTWVQWSKFKVQSVMRNSGVLAGQALSNVPENWDDSIRVAFGASYHFNGALKLRAGFAYDQSPVSSKFRTPRTANSDRIWLSLGANFKFTPATSVDIGYTYIVVNDASLNKTTDISIPALRDTVRGNYDNNVNIFSLQLSQTF